jgi:hypothetical protein
MPRKRPFGVTLLLWLVLCLSAWGAIRLLAALRWWDVLYEFEARLSPLYLSITGAGWAVAGGILLWSLFTAKPWARMAILLSVLLFLAQYWIERIAFQAPRANLPFSLIASILLVMITAACAFNRKTTIFLTRSEEHEQPHKATNSA